MRPLERAVEGRDDAEAEAIHGYCLAVRSALTDDGKPPLEAPGWHRSMSVLRPLPHLSRGSRDLGACRARRERMQFLLAKAVTETASLWSDVQQGYAWVHRAAHILTNDQKQTAADVRQTYEQLLAEMEQAPVSSETLTTMLSTFRKVTTSYWPGLFHCYDHADLPRTNEETCPKAVREIAAQRTHNDKTYHQGQYITVQFLSVNRKIAWLPWIGGQAYFWAQFFLGQRQLALLTLQSQQTQINSSLQIQHSGINHEIIEMCIVWIMWISASLSLIPKLRATCVTT